MPDTASEPPAQFVLASGSPRRAQLLRDAGYDGFVVHATDVDEDDVRPGTLPADAAMSIAAAKAAAAAVRFPHDVVLAADTVVALGDMIIGKPDDAAHAKEILRLLRGTTQVVITAVVVARHAPPSLHHAARVMSAVRMRLMSELEIERYLATGAWRGKAGAYGLQDHEPIVTRVGGCATNVIGLPMTTTKKLLAEAGIVPANG